MGLDSIRIISFGYFEDSLLHIISRNIEQKFLLPVWLDEGHLDLSEYYDSSRLQYNANELLKRVHHSFSSEKSKTIGLFNVDLFIPIFTFIFGQAYLNGQTGIVSHYRLSNERYGMNTNSELFIERFTKEIVHELGHSFGLKHCHIPECVMRSGTYVEDIDQKSSELCSKCKKQVRDCF